MGASEGLGFAIPAPIVNFVYQSLKKYGHVDHVEIGAVAQTITPTLAQGLGSGAGLGCGDRRCHALRAGGAQPA